MTLVSGETLFDGFAVKRASGSMLQDFLWDWI